jgi:hypothetical protein
VTQRFWILAFAFAMCVQSSIAVAAEPQPNNVDDNIPKYRGCLIANVAIFDQAKESVSDTIDAAFYACRNERATIVLDILQSRKKTDENASIAVGDEFVTNAIDIPFREKEFVSLMTSRAEVKNAANR